MALGDCEGIAGHRLPSVRGMIDSTIDNSGPGEPFLVANLDWLWPKIAQSERPDAERIDGIKIDVQGMEIQALKGMFATLQRHRPKLVIEIHEGVSRDELLELIEAAGYFRVGVPIDQAVGEPLYSDNRSYAFSGSEPLDTAGVKPSSFQLA
jgi:hypothetical protein